MTAGYDPSNPAVPGAPGPYERPRHADRSESERLGPLPPRMTSTGSLPPVPSQQTGEIPRPPISPQATSSFSAQPSTGGWPGPAGAPTSAPAGPPFSVPPAPSMGRPRRSRLAGVALALALLLLIVSAVQMVLIVNLDRRVDDAKVAAARQAEADKVRIEGLEGRAKELERKTGANLDAPEVAKAVLPSVFRVIAGSSGGTAFALGKEPANGGTDLITNYHVVEDLYKRGGRDVRLERTSQSYPAKIIKVEEEKDLALLHTDETFPRLAAATEQAKVGEPLLAVGAPLGLEDSVTAGVVSAYRAVGGQQLMQFDASINPGNSGGPVVNARKEVIGVATLKARAAEGIGLAIPVSVVCATFGICA